MHPNKQSRYTSKLTVYTFVLCGLVLAGLGYALTHAPAMPAEAFPTDPKPPAPAFTSSVNSTFPYTPTGYFVNSFYPSNARSITAGNKDVAFLIHSGYVSRSEDGGATWATYRFSGIEDIIVSPNFSQDQKAFAVTTDSNDRIRLSSDGGKTWRSPLAPLQATVYYLFVSPNFAIDQTIYASPVNNEHPLYRSVDGGEHWKSIGPMPLGNNTECRLGDFVISPYFASDHTLYIRPQGSCSKILRSTDGGSTWQAVHDGLYLELGNKLYSIAVIALGNGKTALIAATEWALLISFDLDGKWYILSEDTIHSLLVPEDFGWTGVMFAFNWDDDGLYRTQDFGETWHIVRSDLNSSLGIPVSFSSDYVTDHTIFVRDPATIWRSTNSGSTWQKRVENPLPSTNLTGWQDFVMSPEFETDGTVYAIPYTYSYYGFNWILRSTNAGRSWHAQFLPITSEWLNFLAFSPSYATDRTIYLLFGANLYRSTDGGNTWSGRIKGYNTIPINEANIPIGLEISPNYPQDHTLFVGANRSGIYRSTDSGNHWSRLKAFENLLGFAVSPGYPQDSILYAIFGERYDLYLTRSTDGGTTWQDNPMSFGGYYHHQIHLSPDFVNDNTLFVLSNNGLYRSIDRGEHFELMPSTEDAEYFSISPRYGIDRTIITDKKISEDDGAHWFPINLPYPLVEAGYWQNRLTMVMVRPGYDPFQGLYYYDWPRTEPPPAQISFGIDPEEPEPVSVDLRMATRDERPVPWSVEGGAPWLTMSPLSGTMPSTLTLVADPGGQTLLIDSMQTPITFTFYLSYRLRETYPVATKAFLVNDRVYLPQVFREYESKSVTQTHQQSLDQRPGSSPLVTQERVEFKKPDDLEK